MASKLKHKKRSSYKNHEYKPFDMFIRKAEEKRMTQMFKGEKLNIKGND